MTSHFVHHIYQFPSGWEVTEWAWCSKCECNAPLFLTVISITFVITGGGAIGGLRGALPPQVVVFHTMSTCSTLPGCAVLTELRTQDSGKAIADYAGLHSTSEETKVVAPSCPLKF